MRSSVLSTSLTVLLLALAVAACGPGVRTGDDQSDDQPSDDQPGDDQPPPSARCQAMDIVFVVDDSASMAEEQTNLATNFPEFAQVLDAYEVAPGQPLDYRVAVTTTGRTITTTIVLPGFPPITMTEQGDNGAFRNGCGSQKRWIDRADGNLSSTLACRANVGTGGPGEEMPLYTSMLGLRERLADGTNAGFLRDDALLAMVMITDEDDCSRTDDNISISGAQDICAPGPTSIMPPDTIAFLDNLKGGHDRWAAAVVAAPTDCMSGFGDAVEATKLKGFVSLINQGGTATQNGVFSSICDGNLAPALRTALDTFQAACESFPPVE